VASYSKNNIMVKKQKKGVARKGRQKIQSGIVHIRATFNNTIITVTDPNGNVVSWSSAGACGFKGARKNTPFAAQSAARNAAIKAIELGMEKIEIVLIFLHI
jgi:small subunit ribosomal protein S11